MAPKNKGKKVKKGDDDYWEKAGEDIEPNKPLVEDAGDDDDVFAKKPKSSGFSAFANAGLLVDDVPEEDDTAGGGGLMSLMSNAGKKKDKEKKKKAKSGVTDLEDSAGNDEVLEKEESKRPVEVTAEDLADEEWGPVKEKKKKDKKGKGKQGKKEEEEDEEKENIETPTTTPVAAPEAKDEGGDEEPEESGTKILSKKEKEKLKKEREKVWDHPFLFILIYRIDYTGQEKSPSCSEENG
ncbi:hypothetical protein CPB84DRAFT_1167176 [Gymnopilus junonius]|uniref:Uncharacterized protein n=1 Tax=Gymnopilus junonius TaxID=109634 RepID=A0A9P5NMF6_GYMJU|nr:hypothetical protein CPB84DRAFT_1167176 [Gymnopilus junonius]